jgi:putative transposase
MVEFGLQRRIRMKKSQFTEEQITYALHGVELGTGVAEICRKLGVSEQTCYRWKKKFAGMGVAELRRLKQLVADLSLDKHMLQEVIRKNCKAGPETRTCAVSASLPSDCDQSFQLSVYQYGRGSNGVDDAHTGSGCSPCSLRLSPAPRSAPARRLARHSQAHLSTVSTGRTIVTAQEPQEAQQRSTGASASADSAEINAGTVGLAGLCYWWKLQPVPTAPKSMLEHGFDERQPG